MDTQEFYIVLGGELISLDHVHFRDPSKVHLVGLYTDKEAAIKEWRGHAQQTVDNALMRYFILPVHGELSKFKRGLTARELARKFSEMEPLEPLEIKE